MNANIMNSFDELFADEELCTLATGQSGNTLDAARAKVIRSLSESKALFIDSKHTYLKNGRHQRPVPCFTKRYDGKFVVKVLFSRVTLDLPNGKNGIVCERERVGEIHDKFIQFVQGGAMDDKIQSAQDRYRQSQDRSHLED